MDQKERKQTNKKGARDKHTNIRVERSGEEEKTCVQRTASDDIYVRLSRRERGTPGEERCCLCLISGDTNSKQQHLPREHDRKKATPETERHCCFNCERKQGKQRKQKEDTLKRLLDVLITFSFVSHSNDKRKEARG